MALIKTNGTEFEVADGTRLTQAIKDQGIDILHRCGGNAKCTTCRVTFNEGEPADYHPAEANKLNNDSKMGEFRLSCQIACSGTMDVNVLMTMTSTGMDDPGPDLPADIPDFSEE